MKSKQLILILFLIPALLSAKTLTKNELKTLGARAFHQKAESICPAAANYQLKDCDFLTDNGSVSIAVLHFEHGFLVMSAEDAVMPVLAYDFVNVLDLNNIAPATEQFLSQYRQEIAAARQLNAVPSERVRNAWEELRQPTRATTTTTVVAPLIKSTWNQTKYYNFYSPKDEESPAGYDGRTPNGCVAVAMAQIMFYYRYPATGSSSHTNYTDYGSFHVNFAQQQYNYDAMEDQLNFYNNEVAKLIFHCATSVDMQYGADGSGAYSQAVPGALSTYFKYSNSANHENKTHSSDSAWHVKLKADLDLNRPIYYSGYSEDGGHAFICDGYNSDDLFHFNFGWGGSGNGFYLTESDNSSAVGGFSGWQSAIFSIRPRTSSYPTYCNDRSIDATNGTLEDGSGHLNYQNNAHCTYIIAQKNQYSVEISLQSLFTEHEHDYLRFWNGDPSQDSLLMEFSGTITNPATYNFSTDSLFITFDSDDSTTAQGWRLSYYVFKEGVGCGTQLSHDNNGTITDNSGDYNYRDNSNCNWMLRLHNTPYITFTFEEMDISPEDYLEFSNLNSGEVLATYTGNTLPEPITFYISNVRVRFISDNYLNAGGFRIQWSSSQTGIEDFHSGISLYPNPASDMLHLTMPEETEQCDIIIYNVSGQAVFSQQYDHAGNAIAIPVSQLPNGIYTLRAESNGNTVHRKIVIMH